MKEGINDCVFAWNLPPGTRDSEFLLKITPDSALVVGCNVSWQSVKGTAAQARPATACASILAAASAAYAHHSASAFDRDTEIDIEGTIAELEWKNQHICVTIETTDAEGGRLGQQVEVGPISAVQTFGVPKDMLAPGSKVIVRVKNLRSRNRQSLPERLVNTEEPHSPGLAISMASRKAIPVLSFLVASTMLSITAAAQTDLLSSDFCDNGKLVFD